MTKVRDVIPKHNVTLLPDLNRDNTGIRAANFLDDFYGGYAGVYTSGKEQQDCR